MNNIVDLFKKYREQIMYVLVGGITTFVSLGLKFILDRFFGIIGGLSVAIAEPTAMVVAYVMNKIWVFRTKCKDFKDLVREAISFFSTRIFTIFLSGIISIIFVDILHFNNMIVQVVASVVVVILNYVFAKLIIFKEEK